MASLEAETTAWQTDRDVVKAAKAMAYTGVVDGVSVGNVGVTHATLSSLLPNQAGLNTINGFNMSDETEIDDLFAKDGCRPDYYSAISKALAIGSPTTAPYGYPKTKDIEDKIRHFYGILDTTDTGKGEDTITLQRQLDMMESFRKAYRARIQRKQQSLTHNQFRESWSDTTNANFYNLLLNARINDSTT